MSQLESPGRKKVLMETWGCQMNVADSEDMLHILETAHYERTDDPLAADVVVLNTCHIREKAKHKVLSRLGVLRDLEKDNPKLKVVVAGCVAQAEGVKLLKQAPNIDVLLGPGKLHELPHLLAKHDETNQPVHGLGFTGKTKQVMDQANAPLGDRNVISRFVTIAQGCDNFCTFCVVPTTRGREISRLPGDIVKECQQLIDTGAKEITLLGQNVNSYGHDIAALEKGSESSFVRLLRQVAALPDLERLRFTTSNPHDFTPCLARLFVTEPKLGKYIHLPVQSGNNEVLSRMNRKVTVEEYLERVSWLQQIPDFAISTDLIVGFPGETDEQFEGTLDLVSRVRFSFIYSFKYSPRKGTAAARFRDSIPEKVKDARLKKLNALQDQITIDENLKEIDRERRVLIQYRSKKESDVYYGKTDQFRLVRVPSSRDIVGRTVAVRMTDANKTGLSGQLI